MEPQKIIDATLQLQTLREEEAAINALRGDKTIPHWHLERVGRTWLEIRKKIASIQREIEIGSIE